MYVLSGYRLPRMPESKALKTKPAPVQTEEAPKRPRSSDDTDEKIRAGIVAKKSWASIAREIGWAAGASVSRRARAAGLFPTTETSAEPG